MLDPQDRIDYLAAFRKAMDKFTMTDEEIICIDSKDDGVMVNAIIVVRGKGLTHSVVTTFYKFMNNLERYKSKVKK